MESLVNNAKLRSIIFLLFTTISSKLGVALWPITSSLLQIYGSFTKLTVPHNSKGASSTLLVSSVPITVLGQNLTEVTRVWAEHSIGLTFADKNQTMSEVNWLKPTDVYLLSYELMLGDIILSKHPWYNLIRIAFRIKKAKGVAWVMLPDPFWFKLSFYSTFITAVCGGSIIVSQNTEAQAKKYGLSKVSAPHFWTWPTQVTKEWESTIPWSKRKKTVLFPQGAAGSWRRNHFEFGSLRLESFGYEVISTNYELSFSDYIQLNKQSQIVVTTCLLGEDYVIGQKYYRQTLPKFSVTSRVFESFASGSVLITEENDFLEFLGFHPNLHYLALPTSPSEWYSWKIPSATALENTARAGHEHFIKIKEKYY